MNQSAMSSYVIALKLLAALHAQGSINSATYQNAVKKYGRSA